MNSSKRVATISSGQHWNELMRHWSFPCPACRQVGILRTERESWYACRYCEYAFGIEAAAMKDRQKRFEDGSLFKVGRLL